MRVHRLVQHIQKNIETNLRVWRYLLPPSEEKEGHEIMGSIPVWQPVLKTDHLICLSGMLKNKKYFHFSQSTF